MKSKIIFFLAFTVSISLYAQTPGIKISKVTQRKTYSGASPAVIYAYQILFKKTIATDLKIESLTAIADGNPVDFTVSYNGGKNNNKTIDDNIIKAGNKATMKIQFSKTEQGTTDRRGRPVENTSQSIDLSEGVKLVYSFGGKQYTVELKKFEELAPIKGQ